MSVEEPIDNFTPQFEVESEIEDASDTNSVSEQQTEDLDSVNNNTNNNANTKKERAKAKQKERKRIKNEIDKEQKQRLALSEPAIIADYIAKLVTKNNPDLSAIELQDKIIPEAQIIFTGNKVLNRQDVKKFAPFFEQFGLVKKPKGKDLVLVLCMSAIRVCEVVRVLRGTNKGGALKLIKQNKPEYDRRCLKSPSHIAVSTPGRIYKLQELKLLDIKRIKHIVVDTSMLDSKQRTIWDLDGTITLVSELARTNDAKVLLF